MLCRNQRILTSLLAQLLVPLPGHGPENFGSLILNVRIGMRDIDGTIIREQYVHVVVQAQRAGGLTFDAD